MRAPNEGNREMECFLERAVVSLGQPGGSTRVRGAFRERGGGIKSQISKSLCRDLGYFPVLASPSEHLQCSIDLAGSRIIRR